MANFMKPSRAGAMRFVRHKSSLVRVSVSHAIMFIRYICYTLYAIYICYVLYAICYMLYILFICYVSLCYNFLHFQTNSPSQLTVRQFSKAINIRATCLAFSPRRVNNIAVQECTFRKRHFTAPCRDTGRGHLSSKHMHVAVSLTLSNHVPDTTGRSNLWNRHCCRVQPTLPKYKPIHRNKLARVSRSTRLNFSSWYRCPDVSCLQQPHKVLTAMNIPWIR